MPQKSRDRKLDEYLFALIAQGNHDAFTTLEKRYRKHAIHLTSHLLIQYPGTGVTRHELMTVCHDYFPIVIRKFDPFVHVSFLTFWKESTNYVVMNYLVDNSYTGGAALFRGVVSFNEVCDDSISFEETLAEKDESRNRKRKVFEIRSFIYKYSKIFSEQEFALLNLALDGFSYVELEQSGMMSRTTLHLTFKNALRKLNNCIKHNAQNTK